MPPTAKPASKTKAKGAKAAPEQRANKSSSRAKLQLPAGEVLDALTLLRNDHAEVRELFAAFEEEEGDAGQRDLAVAICVALKVHARLEEEIFYPAIFTALDDASLIEEALVEHASAKDLISQIEAGAPGEALFAARVKVLSEYVSHHVSEEENEIFPLCERSDIDLEALGAVLSMRKQELMTGFTVSNPVLALS